MLRLVLIYITLQNDCVSSISFTRTMYNCSRILLNILIISLFVFLIRGWARGVCKYHFLGEKLVEPFLTNFKEKFKVLIEISL